MISGISSNNMGMHTITQKKDDTSQQEIKSLEHQKDLIQKQIDGIKNGSGDTQSKQQLIKPLQEQMQQIDAEIQQKQVDSVGDQNDHSGDKSNVKTNPNSNGINTKNDSKYAEDALLINASNIYKQIKTVSSVKKGLMGQAKVLNSDADFDEMVHNYRGAEIERAQAGEAKAHAVSLESKEGKLTNKLNKNVKSAIESTKAPDNGVQEDTGTDDKQISAADNDLKDYIKNNSDDNKDDKNRKINVFA